MSDEKKHRRRGVRVTLRLPTEAALQLQRMQTVFNSSQTAIVSQAIGRMYLNEPLAWPPGGKPVVRTAERLRRIVRTNGAL